VHAFVLDKVAHRVSSGHGQAVLLAIEAVDQVEEDLVDFPTIFRTQAREFRSDILVTTDKGRFSKGVMARICRQRSVCEINALCELRNGHCPESVGYGITVRCTTDYGTR
jgi:hypothetical protein